MHVCMPTPEIIYEAPLGDSQRQPLTTTNDVPSGNGSIKQRPPYVSKGGNIPPKILSDAPSICRRHALYSSPRFESSIDGWTPGMEVPSESRVPSRMLRGIDSLSNGVVLKSSILSSRAALDGEDADHSMVFRVECSVSTPRLLLSSSTIFRD